MADFARHLPLSQRRAGDETDVRSDRRHQVADLLDAAAAVLGPNAGRDDVRRFLADTGLRIEGDDPAIAADTVRSGRRCTVRDLARTVRALYVAADAVGAHVTVPAPVAGAVALYAATGGASFDRRAVVRGHTVRATDQDWAFGQGPALQGTAEGIVRFLLALSDDPPRRPAAASGPAATVEE